MANALLTDGRAVSGTDVSEETTAGVFALDSEVDPVGATTFEKVVVVSETDAVEGGTHELSECRTRNGSMEGRPYDG